MVILEIIYQAKSASFLFGVFNIPVATGLWKLTEPLSSQVGSRAKAAGLHHSPRPHWILNPLSEARDPTWILTDPSQVH